MAEYRIRKGEREFSARRIETLQELISRGLLVADDPVSVDGGPFRPAREIDALAVQLGMAADLEPAGDDPWRHWDKVARTMSPAGEPDGVLNAFLDQLASGIGVGASAGSAGPPQLAGLTSGSRPPVARPRAAGVTYPLQIDEVGAEDLAPLDADGPARPSEGSDEPRPLQLDAGVLPPSSSGTSGSSRSSPDARRLRLVEPGSEASGPGGETSDPISFGDWVERKGARGAGVLDGFGRYDPAFSLSTPTRARINPIRVLVVVVIGATAIWFWHAWVKTSANSQFPTEAELIAAQDKTGIVRGDFDGPAITTSLGDGAEAPSPGREVKPEPRVEEIVSISDQEKRLRSGVGQGVREFSNAEMLGDAVFQELLNLRVNPTGVTVDPIRVRQTESSATRRPISANISIRLAGVGKSDGGEVAETIKERLILAWLVVGKYQTLGKIEFQDVEVAFGTPTPYSQTHEGAKLAGFWTGRRTAAALLPGAE